MRELNMRSTQPTRRDLLIAAAAGALVPRLRAAPPDTPQPVVGIVKIRNGKIDSAVEQAIELLGGMGAITLGAVLAIVHDVPMTIGWYCLSGREFNATTVAAILTIIGFSTNDTIVIFDRIREDLKLGIRGTFREVMNQALNQTLSRTLITSGTVFLATLSLFIFGGGAINDFAFTFLIGIITGTYSSIYIASALVLWWHKGQRPQLGAGAQVGVVEGVAAPVRK